MLCWRGPTSLKQLSRAPHRFLLASHGLIPSCIVQTWIVFSHICIQSQNFLTYLGCCLIDISSSFHQNTHHLSVSLLTGNVEWTGTTLYSEKELMRHSWLTTDHSSPSLDTRRPDNHLCQVSSSSNLHKSTSHYRLTVKTSHILLTIEHDMDSKPCQE